MCKGSRFLGNFLSFVNRYFKVTTVKAIIHDVLM